MGISSENGFGYGQIWQAFAMPAARNWATTYTNTSGKPIFVTVTCNNSTISQYTATVNGVLCYQSTHVASTAIQIAVAIAVPAGATYQVNFTAGIPLTPVWTELR